MYLSNYCVNSCGYCGFSRDHKYQCKRLTVDQALRDADTIASEGFRDILLVSGEDAEFITVDYLAELACKLRSKFSSISVEIYQMDREQYAELFKAGIEGVTIYQETYSRDTYAFYHKSGPKSDYDQRISVPDSIAMAGMREIGLGALLGLADWRIETLALSAHAHYLMNRYWQSHVSISFPRIRPAYEVSTQQFEHLLNAKNFVQMILALRLCECTARFAGVFHTRLIMFAYLFLHRWFGLLRRLTADFIRTASDFSGCLPLPEKAMVTCCKWAGRGCGAHYVRLIYSFDAHLS